jgi:hypothetical protein
LDVSFCGWNEHSYNSGTQWTLSRNSAKVTKNFTCTIEGIPNMPPPLLSLLLCRVAWIIFLRTRFMFTPMLLYHYGSKVFIISEQEKRGKFHSYVFLSPCFFTLTLSAHAE